MTPSLDVLVDDLSPEPGLALELARHARRLGERDHALTLLVRAVRSGGWRRGALWAELVAMMEAAEDYVRIRDLWLESPVECHRSISILQAVARAACLAGDHTSGRALLRKAILQHARQQPPAGRVRRRFGKATAGLQPSPRPQTASTEAFEARAGIALRDMNDVLERAAGLRSFLVAGTFLGLHRDANVIARDKDIDVGVFRADADMDDIREAFNADARFSVGRLDVTTDRLRVRHENGSQIDIFPHYEEGGRIWHDGVATRWWNTPFEVEEVEFLGVRELVPADAERYLRESYGDWRTPDSTFEARLDAPNVEITDQEYFDSLLYFGLLHALVNDRPDRRDRYGALLSRTGEGSWVRRVLPGPRPNARAERSRATSPL